MECTRNGDPAKLSMPFGKYAGRTLDQIPTDYLAWVLDHVETLKPTLREAIRLVVFGPGQDFESGRREGIRQAIDTISCWHRKSAIKCHPDRGGDKKIMVVVNCLRDDLVTMLEGVLQ